MMKQYVQHMSGQGEKWEIVAEMPRHWRVEDEAIIIWLPKSEFHICEPPERWEDVTAECNVVMGSPNWYVLQYKKLYIGPRESFRISKVQLWSETGQIENGDLSDPDYKPQWAFIVERKVQP